jgi:hypothetical protein
MRTGPWWGAAVALNVLGAYSFSLPDIPGGLRELRDTNMPDDEDD